MPDTFESRVASRRQGLGSRSLAAKIRGRTDRSLHSTSTSVTCSSSRCSVEAALDVRYACVADVDPQHMVLVAAASAFEAISMAARAVDVWRAAELAAVEDAWRERIEAAQRFYGEAI